MKKLAPEWVRTSDPVIRSPARYHWTTAPANSKGQITSIAAIGNNLRSSDIPTELNTLGNGTCVNGINRFDCHLHCAAGYTGTICETGR